MQTVFLSDHNFTSNGGNFFCGRKILMRNRIIIKEIKKSEEDQCEK